MKIVIAGAGEVGKHLTKILSHDNHEITVIDVSPSELYALSLHLDILTIEGSALSISILQKAKVQSCDLYIAVTHFPEMNVASAVIAKQLGAPKTIARVRDAELLEEKNRLLFENMGIDSIIYPQMLAARKLKKSFNSQQHESFLILQTDCYHFLCLKLKKTMML